MRLWLADWRSLSEAMLALFAGREKVVTRTGLPACRPYAIVVIRARDFQESCAAIHGALWGGGEKNGDGRTAQKKCILNLRRNMKGEMKAIEMAICGLNILKKIATRPWRKEKEVISIETADAVAGAIAFSTSRSAGSTESRSGRIWARRRTESQEATLAEHAQEMMLRMDLAPGRDGFDFERL